MKTAAVAAAPLILPATAAGANARVGVGCIGVGPQGCGVMRGFLHDGRARVVAVCDVKAPRRAEAKALVDRHYGNKDCATHLEFRDLLARDDVDVVTIASTDHWHVLHALHAARAGKDMYVEKPLGLNVQQGQALRAAVRRHGVRFQFGTQQRSDRNFRFACELVRNGYIGAVHTARVGAPASVASPNFPPQPVPDWIDYDRWLGPAPWAPFAPERVSNSYWWHMSEYAVGFVAGWGIHHVDIAQWGLGTELTGPVHIEGSGVFPRDGMCDCATAWDMRLTYADGRVMHFTDNQKNAQGVRFEGSEGWVYVKRGHIDAEPKSLLRLALKPSDTHLYESASHAGNLVDCALSRAETICPIAVAVRSDTICYLSDICMRLERPLAWDPAAERFVDDAEANRYCGRAMRPPWRL